MLQDQERWVKDYSYLIVFMYLALEGSIGLRYSGPEASKQYLIQVGNKFLNS
jgi:hypothetical protein